MKRLVVLVLILVIATGLFATPLWNGTWVGMSMDEVEGLFSDKESIRREYVDGEGTLSIRDYEDDNFIIKNVSFHFFEDRLIAVQVEVFEWEFIRSFVMIAKYGPCVDHFSYVDRYSGIQETWTWINGKILITMQADSLGGDGTIIYVDIDSIDVLIPGANLL